MLPLFLEPFAVGGLSESPRTAMLAPPGAPDAAHWWIPLVVPLVVVIDPAVRAAGGQRGGGERARCAGSD
jgi:hypothetical protein